MSPRAATTGVFFVNGAAIGVWVAQIPFVQHRFDLAKSTLGLILLTMSIGVIVALPIMGQAVVRLGSARAVRIFLLHHVTWSINSVCHFFGTRRFEVDDHSTNVFWLAPLSFGESWHHNHHAFPRSAMHGLRWWEVDPTAWVIRAMKASKLAWNVVEISPERQREKLAL